MITSSQALWARLRSAVAYAQRHGLSPGAGLFISPQNDTCCLLGALAYSEGWRYNRAVHGYTRPDGTTGLVAWLKECMAPKAMLDRAMNAWDWAHDHVEESNDWNQVFDLAMVRYMGAAA